MPFPKEQNVTGWVEVGSLYWSIWSSTNAIQLGSPFSLSPGHAEPYSKKLVLAEVARILEAFPERSELTTVGGIPTPLKKYELVSCSQYMGNYGKCHTP